MHLFLASLFTMVGTILNLLNVLGAISYGTIAFGHLLDGVAFLFILLPVFSSSILRNIMFWTK